MILQKKCHFGPLWLEKNCHNKLSFTVSVITITEKDCTFQFHKLYDSNLGGEWGIMESCPRRDAGHVECSPDAVQLRMLKMRGN